MEKSFYKKIITNNLFLHYRLSRKFSQIKSLPFNISRENVNRILIQKTSIFEQNIDKKGLIAKSFSDQYKGDPITKIYLPFYSANVIGLWSKYQGQYGIDRIQYYITHSKQRGYQTKSRTVTDWYSISGSISPNDYLLGTKKIQIYAGFEYPRHYIQNSLRTEELHNLKQMDVVQAKNIKISPHQMKMSFAVQKIIAGLHQLQEQRICRHIQTKYKADHSKVNYIDMMINDSRIDYQTFHLPAYIYNFCDENLKLFKCVSGFNGKYEGQTIYSPIKVGLAGGIGGIGITLLTMFFSGNPFFLAGAALSRLGMVGLVSTIISGLIAKYGSLYKYRKHRSKLHDQIKYNQTKAAQDDQDFLKKQKEKQQKYKQNNKSNQRSENQNKEKSKQNSQNKKSSSGQSQKQQNWNKYGFMNLYPQDQCRLLGLNPKQKITIQKLKTARNTKIKQWHPDRFKGNNDLANEMCGRINNAYQVLTKLVNSEN